MCRVTPTISTRDLRPFVLAVGLGTPPQLSSPFALMVVRRRAANIAVNPSRAIFGHISAGLWGVGGAEPLVSLPVPTG